MATDNLALCHKLIALATNNPNEEEAKLAALKAVKIIKEHNLLPGAPPVSRRAVPPPPSAHPFWGTSYRPSQEQEAYYRRTGPDPRGPARDPYGDPIYEDFFNDLKRKVEEEKKKSDERQRERAAQYEAETHRQEEKRKKRAAQDAAEFQNKQRRESYKASPEYSWSDYKPPKPDNGGHNFSLGNVCSNCKMPRSLYESTGINCRGYQEAREGASKTGGNIPFEVQQELDRLLKTDPAQAKKMKDFLDSLYKKGEATTFYPHDFSKGTYCIKCGVQYSGWVFSGHSCTR